MKVATKPVTVRELMAALSQCDPDGEVTVQLADSDPEFPGIEFDYFICEVEGLWDDQSCKGLPNRVGIRISDRGAL